MPQVINIESEGVTTCFKLWFQAKFELRDSSLFDAREGYLFIKFNLEAEFLFGYNYSCFYSFYDLIVILFEPE